MRKSLSIIVLATSAYAATIFLIRGLLSSSIQSTMIFLVGPLVILATMFTFDLGSRAKVAHPVGPTEQRLPSLSHEVQQLSKRIEVGKKASPDYYNEVLLNRLKDALVEKASVETGMSVDNVRKILRNPRAGREFLKDDNLYNLLYTEQPPAPGDRRQEMLDKVVNLIEAWNA